MLFHKLSFCNLVLFFKFLIENQKISWLWFFGLLSSSLLGWVETLRFGCCILLPFSSVPCLSEHRNDSTWEVIFNVWLLIKQGIQLTTMKMCTAVPKNQNQIITHQASFKKFRKIIKNKSEKGLKPKGIFWKYWFKCTHTKKKKKKLGYENFIFLCLRFFLV